MSETEGWRAEIRRRTTAEIRLDEEASRRTSIGVGGRIDAIVFPRSEEELAQTVRFLKEARIPFLPVGNWTNLIVTDRGYRGALVSLSGLTALDIGEGPDGDVRLTAQAGVSLAELVNISIREALTGIEFCAGIPGSLGGALRMNAGAYGGEIKDIVETVRLLDPSGEIREASRSGLRFTYRSLDLSAETVIIGAVLRLRRSDGASVSGKIREIIEMRRGKHPLEFPSAGSIFRNPREVPAGKLIDQAGLKGFRIGDAQVSEKHGNFIVNRGKARAEEILSLIALIQRRVFETTGHQLRTEVKIIGE